MEDNSCSPVGLSAVDELTRRAAVSPGVISLAGGLPDAALFPKKQLCEAFLVAIGAPDSAPLQYGWPEGSAALRAYVADGLRARGAEVEPERVIITSGAQQAIVIALSAIEKHGRIGVDDESYPGALELFRSRNSELASLNDPADLYYVMPSVSNPRGRRMSLDERSSLLDHVRRHRALVLEDDAYDGTRFDGQSSRPLLADAPERVFHVGTFSKTLCPGLRVGWLVPPRRFMKRALRQKQNQDLQANGLTQALLMEYLRQGDFARLQRRARQLYRRKAGILAAAVAKHLPQFRGAPPQGGFSLWLDSSLPIDEQRLLEAAVSHGVSFDPGSAFRRVSSPRLALRLCFSTTAEADLEQGVQRLARALSTIAPARGAAARSRH